MTSEESLEILTSTSLWKHTLGKKGPHAKPLRDSFLRSRENAMPLLAQIREDFPNLTIHDITHVGSLWRVADTIIGPNYPINPLEGYILGMAFLIHDAAHSYEAMGGEEALRNTIEWKDFHTGEHDGKNEEEFKKECDFAAIRELHAQKAGEMLTRTFTKDNGTTFHLIENESYQNHYGNLIGQIAASHQWDIEDLDRLGDLITPLSEMPNAWKINPQKLACILRCADAGHIDNGRAPDNIYFDRSLAINGVSRKYWAAQNHLGQLCEDDNDKTKLVITSSNAFPKKEFAAWNVAHEAVMQLDKEIRKSNEMLRQLSKKENLFFPHVGVIGAESREALAKYIKTDGWNPCDMNVHTSNVKALIEELGGSKLYGEKNMLLVALRELIQNARDAIHARRTMDPQHFGIDGGKITIRLIEEDGKRIIEVEDNGIGMSRDCIKNHLLDFGSSYWKSALAVRENPGLRGKGFTSVGKFGIGFYSIFMVAKSVEVITRKYCQGETANKLEFPDGLTLSPILSDDTLRTEVSTIVRFELKNEKEIKLTFDTIIGDDEEYDPFDLDKVISILTIGLDVDLYFEYGNNISQIHQNVASVKFKNDSEEKKKWLSRLFLCNIPQNINEISSKLEELTDEHGKLRGWVLSPEWTIKMEGCDFSCFTGKLVPMVETIGGLSSMLDLQKVYRPRKGFLGYIDGIDNSVSRDKLLKDETLRKCLREWVKKNYRKNYNEILKSNDLSDEYENLIKYTCLEDEIIKDNVKCVYNYYKNRKLDNHIGTVVGIVEINKRLYAGVSSTSRRIYGISEDLVNSIHVSYMSTFDKKTFFYKNVRDHESRKILSTLFNICDSDNNSFGSIIRKYASLEELDVSLDKKLEKTLRIWVNLILYQNRNEMIDWRGVDKKYKRTAEDMQNYLYRLLSPTYLEEITVPTEGEGE